MKTVLEYLADGPLEMVRARFDGSSRRARRAVTDAVYNLQSADHLLFREALEKACQRAEGPVPTSPTREERVAAIVNLFLITGALVLGSSLDLAALEDRTKGTDKGAKPARPPVDPDRLTPGVN